MKVWKNLLIITPCIGLLTSCYPMNQIQNPTLRDKVYACGVIWGDSINSELAVQMDNHLTMHGGVQAGFRDEVKSIFDKLPAKDAGAAYKNYIGCIENLKVAPAPTTKN